MGWTTDRYLLLRNSWSLPWLFCVWICDSLQKSPAAYEMLHRCLISGKVFQICTCVTVKWGQNGLFSPFWRLQTRGELVKFISNHGIYLRLSRKCFSCPMWKNLRFTNVPNLSPRQNKTPLEAERNLDCNSSLKALCCRRHQREERWELLPHGKSTSVIDITQGRLLQNTGSALGECSKSCACFQCCLLLRTRTEWRNFTL